MSDHIFTLRETDHEVWLSRSAADYKLHLGDAVLEVELTREGKERSILSVDGRSEPVTIALHGDTVHVHLDGAMYTLRYSDALSRLARQSQGRGGDSIVAPMPGTVVAVHAIAGATVRRGEALLVIESMKLETTIAAPRDAVVEAVQGQLGRSFERDAVLVTLAPMNEPGAAAEPGSVAEPGGPREAGRLI